MGWLKQLFSRKQRTDSVVPKNIKELTVNNDGKISANVACNINGTEYNVPISTTVNKLEKEAKEKEANISNPLSCEREPDEDEIKIPTSFFKPSVQLAGCSISKKYFGEYIKASIKFGYNYMIVNKKDYQEVREYIVKNLRREYILQRSAYLNTLGIAFEKEGKIEEAIKQYEEAILMRSNGRHAYDRLAIIYRKANDKENEIRVLNIAVSVFGNEYKERLEKANGTYVKPVIVLPQKGTPFYWDCITFGEEYQETKVLFPEFDFYNSDDDRSHSFLNSEYKHSIWRIQNLFNDLIVNAENKEKEGRLDEAAVIYERIVSQNYWLPTPYDRLIKIYAKAKLKEDEKRIIVLSINFFSELRAKQEEYILSLAKKYGKLDFAKEIIENNKKITYYLGSFELYNPYPIIEKWKERLTKVDTSITN